MLVQHKHAYDNREKEAPEIAAETPAPQAREVLKTKKVN